jgi:hypothetical protein
MERGRKGGREREIKKEERKGWRDGRKGKGREWIR